MPAPKPSKPKRKVNKPFSLSKLNAVHSARIERAKLFLSKKMPLKEAFQLELKARIKEDSRLLQGKTSEQIRNNILLFLSMGGYKVDYDKINPKDFPLSI